MILGRKRNECGKKAIDEAEADGESSLLDEESALLNVPGVRKQVALENTSYMEEWENAEMGISPRANALMRANIPLKESGHGDDLAAKIMWFADACLSGTTICPINVRFDNLEKDSKNGARNIAFSESYKNRYHGKTLYQVQREIGERYEREFAEKLEVSPNEMYQWLISQVNRRIQLQQLPVLPK